MLVHIYANNILEPVPGELLVAGIHNEFEAILGYMEDLLPISAI